MITIKKNGKGYKGSCPLHDDTDPSLSISPDQCRWNCFGCK
ncbi:MAG: hypothetical protein J7K15_10670 [Deltaproteobacteria bacterium]|nr:hypothetical protein [Deltaproteobacteria bacterium]